MQSEVLDREDLLQKRPQSDFAQTAPDLRGLKNLLQTPDVLPERKDLLAAPPQFAQAQVDVGDEAAGVGAGLLQRLGVLREAQGHLAGHLVERDAHFPGNLRADLRDLLRQAGDLLLKEDDRGFRPVRGTGRAVQEDEAENDHRRRENRQDG